MLHTWAGGLAVQFTAAVKWLFRNVSEQSDGMSPSPVELVVVPAPPRIYADVAAACAGVAARMLPATRNPLRPDSANSAVTWARPQ